MGAVEAPSVLPLVPLQERVVSLLVSFTTFLAGLCFAMSVVTCFIRLVQHAAAWLG